MKKICKMLYAHVFILCITFQVAYIQSEKIDLYPYEKRLISQFGEDGVIEKIFSLIGTTNQYYVEFGAGDGHFCSNTKYLREKYGWQGLLLEGSYTDNLNINLHKEFITAENICSLFRKYNVPQEFDLISIDIDRNDFYVWKSLSEFYRPRVVIIEFNKLFNPTDDKVIIYSPQATWNGGEYTGASILAMFNLGKKFGYSLIYQPRESVNLFFIRDDVLEKYNLVFNNMNNLSKIYNGNPGFLHQNIHKEKFISSQEILSK